MVVVRVEVSKNAIHIIIIIIIIIESPCSNLIIISCDGILIIIIPLSFFLVFVTNVGDDEVYRHE